MFCIFAVRYYLHYSLRLLIYSQFDITLVTSQLSVNWLKRHKTLRKASFHEINKNVP